MSQPTDLEFPEVERYELHEKSRFHFEPDRREFLGVLGAGIVLTVAANPAHAQRSNRGNRNARRDEKLSERFHIGVDGIVTVLTSKVEVGQDSRTQLTQAAAEELRLPIEQIRLIMADTDLCPDDGGTAGSRTTPSTVPRVRNAAAALREVLVGLASAKLRIPTAEVTFDRGIFTAKDQRRVTLAELATGKDLNERLSVVPSSSVRITSVDQWQVLGTTVPKTTGMEVVTGSKQYPSDIRREGMLYGRILRAPSFDAKLVEIDLEPAKSMEDVHVVRDGDLVACVAVSSWQASKAIDAIAHTAKWKEQLQPVNSRNLFEQLKRPSAGSLLSWPRPRQDTWGNGLAALADAEKTFKAAYTVAYIQHAPMEPRAAVAEWQDGKLTVWTGSQQPARVQSELTQAFRLESSKVRVIVPDTGGGFGGKHTGEVAVEAARLAKSVGKPVSLRWTREEEFTWAYFRPAGVIEVEAGLDSSGNVVAWDFTNYNSGSSAIESPYQIPNGRTRFIGSNAPLRQGSYRALASTANAFARESAMDELASIVDADPLEFRLRHLENGRLKDVLIAAAEKFDWRERKKAKSPNRGIGLACGTEKGSFVAACAEVEVTDGEINVLKVCEAYECGAIQNPRNLRAQVEGAIVMGLGGALTEEIRFQNGQITSASFSSYQVPRMIDLPELDIVLVNRPDLESIGAGETPIIAVAPAIANAVHHAIGHRSRSMPIRVPASS